MDRQPYAEVAGEPERYQTEIDSLRPSIGENGKRRKQTFEILDEPIEVKCTLRGVELLGVVDTIEIESRGIKIVQKRVQFERPDRLNEDHIVKGLC